MPTKPDLLAKLELAELRALAQRYGLQHEAASRQTNGAGLRDATAATSLRTQTDRDRASLIAALSSDDQVVLHEAFSKHYSPARLRDLCTAFGLDTSGKKLDFITRLTGHPGRPRELIKQTLETLSVKRLGKLCDTIGIDRTDLVKRDELVDLVVRAKRFSFKEILEHFTVAELKPVCRALGLSDSGDKDELVARILSRVQLPAAPTASDPVVPSRRKRATAQITSTKPMEQMLWDAACSIRGEKDAAKFKDYLLPLLFLKRLSDVFDDEIERLAEDYGDRAAALEIAEGDHSLLRFYLPAEARWAVISGRQAFEWPPKERPRDVGEHLTKALRAVVKQNPSLSGVIDLVDFAAERNGERDMNPAKLRDVVETFSDPRYRLGLADVQPDFLGRAYEYLLRKFAEGSGQSAGEFFTPTEVGFLMAWILRPRPGQECHDYACGSLGLVIKLQLVARELDPTSKVPLKLSGQELQTESYAIAKMNAIIHDMDADIQRGDTIINPKFRAKDGRLRQYDIVVANPMWNQPLSVTTLATDPFDRFRGTGGITSGRGDWAWLQHTLACLNDHGRAAVVLDTGAVTRGSGARNEDKERNIRKWFVDHDLIDGVILLPDNLFYNTTAAGIIVVLSRRKPSTRKGKIVLLNASRRLRKGRPKNFIPEEDIRSLADLFNNGEPVDGEVAVITRDQAEESDYNLSPSRWVGEAVESSEEDLAHLIRELGRLSSEAQVLDETVTSLLQPLAGEGG